MAKLYHYRVTGATITEIVIAESMDTAIKMFSALHPGEVILVVHNDDIENQCVNSNY